MASIIEKFSRYDYSVSSPRIKVARALNKCRSCLRNIQKGEKYIQCVLLDPHQHQVNIHGRKIYRSFHVIFKFCRDCSVELLKLNASGRLPKNFERKVLLTIHELLFVRNRFSILKEENILFNFLLSKGIKLSTTCPKCGGQGKVWNKSQAQTIRCDFPGCDNGSLVCGYKGNLNI
jgi:hypothetical protein